MKTTKTSLIIIVFIFLGILDARCQTIAPNNAYGDNQAQVELGVFAIYSGDINQDGFISTDDVALVDADNLAGLFGGYILTDLNGDTFVSTDDVALVDTNNSNGVFVNKP